MSVGCAERFELKFGLSPVGMLTGAFPGVLMIWCCSSSSVCLYAEMHGGSGRGIYEDDFAVNDGSQIDACSTLLLRSLPELRAPMHPPRGASESKRLRFLAVRVE